MPQFSVKRNHILRTSFIRWGHHTIHPLCLCILCFESPLFYIHCNRKGDVMVIPSLMGTCQGDPLGGTIFVLCFIASHFSFCLFPSIGNDIHIICPFLIISSAYEHFQTKLHRIGFFLSNLINV